MSEKIKNTWDATKAGGEENEEDYLEDIIKLLNAKNRKLGYPEVSLVKPDQPKSKEPDLANGKKRQSLDEIKAAGKSDVYDPIEMANEMQEAREKEMEQVRASDVMRIMAEEAAAKEEEEKGREREIVPATEIVKHTTAFDPEMQEITLEKAKRKEIDVIGQGTEPIDKELAKKVDEMVAIQKRVEELNQKIAKIKGNTPEIPEDKPLVAVGVDWTKSEDRIARKMAREDLKDEMKEAGLIKRIWKGKLFKKYYEEKYMDEYLTGDRVDKDGRDLYEIIDEQKQEMLDDIIYDVTEDVHELNQAEWGKNLVPMDEETNEKIKSTIEDYARFMTEIAEIKPDMADDPEFVKEVDERFDRYLFRVLEEAENDGRIDGYIENNNYLETAREAARRYKEAVKNARNKVEQDAAMAKVMAGFRAYNYESRKKFTNEHEGNIDKILDNLGTDKIGQFVPAETLSNAIDAVTRDPAEASIINGIKNNEDLIGGEEGVRIMLDKSPITTEYMARCQKWWNKLSNEDKKHVEDLVRKIDAYPSRYNVKWGNGFRTWFTIRDSLVA